MAISQLIQFGGNRRGFRSAPKPTVEVIPQCLFKRDLRWLTSPTLNKRIKPHSLRLGAIPQTHLQIASQQPCSQAQSLSHEFVRARQLSVQAPCCRVQ